MQLAQRGYVGRCAPPARLRPAAQCAQPGAGRVDEHAVETACRQGRFAAVGPHHLDRKSAGVLLDHVGSALVGFDGGHGRPPLRGDRGDQRGFAAGAGAQVQPAPAVLTRAWGERQRKCHQLAALVLDQCPGVTHRVQPTRVAAAEVHRIRRVLSGRAADLGCQVVGAEHPGPRCQMHSRSGVVGGQCDVQFPRVGAERVGEGLGDPARVGVHEGGAPDRVGVGGRGEFGHPGSLVPLGDGPQHRVDESSAGGVEFHSGLFHGGRHRGMFGDVGPQQLVGTQPQQIQQHRVDLVHRASGRRRNDRIQQPAGAASAVGQLSRKGRVPAADPTLGQQRRKGQVGVGVAIGHRAQHVEGRASGRVQLGPTWPTRPGPVGVGTATGVRRAAAAGPGTLIHDARTSGSSRAPRAQSGAAIGFLPGG